MNMSYKGICGYHPLLISSANTQGPMDASMPRRRRTSAAVGTR
jgi:hypothetical protein